MAKSTTVFPGTPYFKKKLMKITISKAVHVHVPNQFNKGLFKKHKYDASTI